MVVLLIGCQVNGCTKSQQRQEEQVPPTDSPSAKVEQFLSKEAERLLLAYPSQIRGLEDNYILFVDSARLLFDDHKEKSTEELMENPDVQDMFTYSYPIGEMGVPAKFHNPGRIRNDDFFKTMYGKTAAEVQNNLVEIVWCPKLVGQKLSISKINGVNKQLAAVSAELDEHPEWKDYLRSSGTFFWQTMRGTNNRLSAHSFGISIDLNKKYANYWQWECNCTSENVDLYYPRL